jgi:predicted ester cyclase
VTNESFPDLRTVIESMVAERDEVAVPLTMSGIHWPTELRTTRSAMAFAHLAEGQVTEYWRLIDSRQLERDSGKLSFVRVRVGNS